MYFYVLSSYICFLVCVFCVFVYYFSFSIHNCPFPIFVWVYWWLPLGGNPVAVNKYCIIYIIWSSGSIWWCIWLDTLLQARRSQVWFPMGVIGIFHWLNPSDHIMALELTQPLTEISTRDIYSGVKVSSAYGWQPYHLVLIVEKFCDCQPHWALMACPSL
jgi:hypothetical protein